MKLIWMAAPALVAVIVAGCSDDTPASGPPASTSAAVAASSASEKPDAPGNDEADGVVRILLGETKSVPVPADAVLDIRVPVAWGAAADGIRCAVTEGSGRNEDLRSSDVKKTETVGGAEWMTVWTFSSAPTGEVTVGCKDPESKIAAAHPDPYIRVVPRDVVPVPPAAR